MLLVIDMGQPVYVGKMVCMASLLDQVNLDEQTSLILDRSTAFRSALAEVAEVVRTFLVV